MKNMKFDIDIIWVNRDNQIVHIVYAVSKDSYPKRFETQSIAQLPTPSSYPVGHATATVSHLVLLSPYARLFAKYILEIGQPARQDDQRF